jgi:hypothetical protein
MLDDSAIIPIIIPVNRWKVFMYFFLPLIFAGALFLAFGILMAKEWWISNSEYRMSIWEHAGFVVVLLLPLSWLLLPFLVRTPNKAVMCDKIVLTNNNLAFVSGNKELLLQLDHFRTRKLSDRIALISLTGDNMNYVFWRIHFDSDSYAILESELLKRCQTTSIIHT